MPYLYVKDLFTVMWKQNKSYTLPSSHTLPSQQIPSGPCATWNEKRTTTASVCLFCYFCAFIFWFSHLLTVFPPHQNFRLIHQFNTLLLSIKLRYISGYMLFCLDWTQPPLARADGSWAKTSSCYNDKKMSVSVSSLDISLALPLIFLVFQCQFHDSCSICQPISVSHVVGVRELLDVSTLMLMKREMWWERWRGGKRYDPSSGSQIKSNCVGKNAPFLPFPFSLPSSCSSSPSLLKDVGSDSANCLWLFVYVQFVRGLASFPPLSKKPFTILFMSTCLIHTATHSYGPRAWLSLHAFAQC